MDATELKQRMEEIAERLTDVERDLLRHFCGGVNCRLVSHGTWLEDSELPDLKASSVLEMTAMAWRITSPMRWDVTFWLKPEGREYQWLAAKVAEAQRDALEQQAGVADGTGSNSA